MKIIHMEFYSTRKKVEIMAFSGKYMELEIIMLSGKKKPGSEREILRVFSYMWRIWIREGRKRQGIVGHICNLSTREAMAEGS
jgi:hypothetical protein